MFSTKLTRMEMEIVKGKQEYGEALNWIYELESK